MLSSLLKEHQAKQATRKEARGANVIYFLPVLIYLSYVLRLQRN